MNYKRVMLFFTILLILNSIIIVHPVNSSLDIVTQTNSLDLRDLSQWWWEELELITEDNTGNSADERSTVDVNDNIHVCWRDSTDYDGCGTDNDIFYRKYNALTNSWLPVEVVSTESTNHGYSPSIAADILGNIHVVWHDYTDIYGAGADADIFYKEKDFSTGIWSDTEIVSPSSADQSYYPNIAVDSFGNAHIVWQDFHDYDGTDTDVIYKKRDATSETWSASTIISSESNDDSNNPVIIIDNSDIIHVAWDDTSSGMYGSGIDRDVFYKKWDSVNLWSDGSTLSFESTDECFYPFITFDDSNSIHAVWSDTTDINGAGTDYDVFYCKWSSSSQTWSPSHVISTESSGFSTDVALTIDSYFLAHFVWCDSSNMVSSGFDEDIYYCSFDIETESLSDLVLLSSLSDDHSYTPEICIDSNDHLHVFIKDYHPLLDSGTDGDIFYRKYVGPPEIPILASFTSSTNTVGNLTLNWSPTSGADEYKIYRSTSYIWNVDSLSPIDTSTSNTFNDNLEVIGTYFYTIVASSIYGDSGLSNVESIEIVDSTSSGLFASLDWGEIIILGGFLGALQIIFAIVILATKSSGKTSKKITKGKK